MHHHHTRYDDVDHLKAELDQEKRYRETIEWSNAELERSITELEAYLMELEKNSRGVDDNEWKVRFESQTALNKQLQEQKDWLETELAEARRRLTTGSYPEAMNFNLDALNEPELLRLVKHLERMRNDFYSTLRDTEWKLDKESKEFHHFDEMRRVYKSDLKHANSTIERMRLGSVLDSSGSVSPMYPPGYFRWLESHTPGGYGAEGEGRGRAAGKKGGKKGGNGGGVGGGGGGGGGERGRNPNKEMNQSPQRSKSRADKKSKKKDAPPPEDRHHSPEPPPPQQQQQQQPPRGGRSRSRKESIGNNTNTSPRHNPSNSHSHNSNNGPPPRSMKGNTSKGGSDTEVGNGSDVDDGSGAGDDKRPDGPSTADTFTITIAKEEEKLKAKSREGSKGERTQHES